MVKKFKRGAMRTPSSKLRNEPPLEMPGVKAQNPFMPLDWVWIKKIIGSEGAYDWKINGTRSWLILSECHWLTIIGELRSLWFIIIFNLHRAKISFSSTLFICCYIFCSKAQLDAKEKYWKVDEESRISKSAKTSLKSGGKTFRSLTGGQSWLLVQEHILFEQQWKWPRTGRSVYLMEPWFE